MWLAIAKEFSVREEERFLSTVGMVSPAAYTYLCRIPKDAWRSTPWTQEELPRRYGIVTSNTREAVNNWLKDARSLTWSSALETIGDRMINRISDCREKLPAKAR